MGRFFLGSYSVIANDSVQTLGTWIASNSENLMVHIMVCKALSCCLHYGTDGPSTMVIYRMDVLNKIP